MRHRFKAGHADLLAAALADAVGAFFDPAQRFVDVIDQTPLLGAIMNAISRSMVSVPWSAMW